jgi:hypothetical protein
MVSTEATFIRIDACVRVKWCFGVESMQLLSFPAIQSVWRLKIASLRVRATLHQLSSIHSPIPSPSSLRLSASPLLAGAPRRNHARDAKHGKSTMIEAKETMLYTSAHPYLAEVPPSRRYCPKRGIGREYHLVSGIIVPIWPAMWHDRWNSRIKSRRARTLAQTSSSSPAIAAQNGNSPRAQVFMRPASPSNPGEYARMMHAFPTLHPTGVLASDQAKGSPCCSPWPTRCIACRYCLSLA